MFVVMCLVFLDIECFCVMGLVSNVYGRLFEFWRFVIVVVVDVSVDI